MTPKLVAVVDRGSDAVRFVLARFFRFKNAGDTGYLLASADWMPRDLNREILDIQLPTPIRARRV